MNLIEIRRALLAWYRRDGRADLPWRVRRDPYLTVVSEFMLQQTQVERVAPAFEAFVARFGSFAELAAASTADVVRQWKGLGYNSRAVRLQRLAQAVVERHAGTMPSDAVSLRALAGVGPYTAAAIAAFAFDADVAACDTNVRRVVHRIAYGIEFPRAVPLAQLDELAMQLVPPGQGHDWNSAMMDLGAMICTARAPKCLLCPLNAVCAAAPIDARQLDAARLAAMASKRPPAVKFEKTTRYARGRIVDRLRELPPERAISLLDLHSDLRRARVERSLDEIDALVAALVRDGVIESNDGNIRLRH
jgi:A/G-specific adenine glycosylase